MSDSPGTPEAQDARGLVVVLHDLAWLLPRTIAAESSRPQPLPPTELEIMRLLTRRPGLSVNDVASELGLLSTNVSTSVRSLVDRGLLQRDSDSSDKRVVRLSPTEEALREREDREDAWGKALDGILAGISDSDRSRLLAAIPAMRELATRLAGRDR